MTPGLAACPLCGAEEAAAAQPEEPDDYQAKVRALREELQRLRRDGAA
ncbi:MAG TPA: hypothetical protein VM573_03840 [Actinomycetota bacterium]|nr:hypothetical protein [Actinomycetota bacterium]